MNVALAAADNKVVSLLPGAKLRIEPEKPGLRESFTEIEAGWYPLVWGQNLKHHDVSLLLCAGIERFMAPTIRGILQQCGINIVSNVTGSVEEVMGLWRSGRLIAPVSFEKKPQTGWQAGRMA